MKAKLPTVGCAVLSVAAAVLLMACGKSADGQGGPQGPVTVGVYEVQTQAVSLGSELPGRVVASRVAEVRPQTSGIVQKRLFEEGSEVKKGQPLYQIDPATLNARLAKAQAQLVSAENLAQRYALLRDKNAISQQQYDDAQSAKRVAQCPGRCRAGAH